MNFKCGRRQDECQRAGSWRGKVRTSGWVSVSAKQKPRIARDAAVHAGSYLLGGSTFSDWSASREAANSWDYRRPLPNLLPAPLYFNLRPADMNPDLPG